MCLSVSLTVCFIYFVCLYAWISLSPPNYLKHLVEGDISEPRVALVVNIDAMREEEATTTPGAYHRPTLRIQHHHGVVTKGSVSALVVVCRVESPYRGKDEGGNYCLESEEK